jgi:hypothetical protein
MQIKFPQLQIHLSDSNKFGAKAETNFTNKSKIRITGDQHGNQLRLMTELIDSNVISLEQHLYEELLQLYTIHPHEITLKNKTRIQLILASLIPGENANITNLFLGDLITDRWPVCDFFMLEFLKNLTRCLNTAEGKYCITFSNHDALFIEVMETGRTQFRHPYTYSEFKDYNNYQALRSCYKSLDNLDILIKKGIVSKKEIVELYETYYLPNVMAISYVYDPENQQLGICSHAPIGLNTIEDLAKAFQVPYSENVSGLMACLDDINSQFLGLLKEQKLSLVLKSNTKHPLNEIIFNRDYSNLRFSEQLQHTETSSIWDLIFIHGHESSPNGRPPVNIRNLDCLFAKAPSLRDVPYTYLTLSNYVIKHPSLLKPNHDFAKTIALSSLEHFKKIEVITHSQYELLEKLEDLLDTEQFEPNKLMDCLSICSEILEQFFQGEQFSSQDHSWKFPSYVERADYFLKISEYFWIIGNKYYKDLNMEQLNSLSSLLRKLIFLRNDYRIIEDKEPDKKLHDSGLNTIFFTISELIEGLDILIELEENDSYKFLMPFVNICVELIELFPAIEYFELESQEDYFFSYQDAVEHLPEIAEKLRDLEKRENTNLETQDKLKISEVLKEIERLDTQFNPNLELEKAVADCLVEPVESPITTYPGTFFANTDAPETSTQPGSPKPPSSEL